MEDAFAMFGVPDSITHDGGPPYQSHDWEGFAREQGFKSKLCSPEHPQANGLVERFMDVLRKTVHTAKVEDEAPMRAVKRKMLNYRNTPHPTTGKAPAALLFGRMMKTRIPGVIKVTF